MLCLTDYVQTDLFVQSKGEVAKVNTKAYCLSNTWITINYNKKIDFSI